MAWIGNRSRFYHIKVRNHPNTFAPTFRTFVPLRESLASLVLTKRIVRESFYAKKPGFRAFFVRMLQLRYVIDQSVRILMPLDVQTRLILSRRSTAKHASVLLGLHILKQVPERQDCEGNQRPPYRTEQQGEGNYYHQQRQNRKDECDEECDVFGSR